VTTVAVKRGKKGKGRKKRKEQKQEREKEAGLKPGTARDLDES